MNDPQQGQRPVFDIALTARSPWGYEKKGRLGWALSLIAALLSWSALPASAGPGTPETRESMLVTTEWLSEHLNNPGLLLLHMGRAEDYEREHLPGARLIPVSEIIIRSPEGLFHEIPPQDALRAAFESLGADDNSRIVIYSTSGRTAFAARAFVTLDYLGLAENSALLDGGLAKWKNENRPITAATVAVKRRNLSASTNSRLLVDSDWIAAHKDDPDILLVDGRPNSFFAGSEKEGHIARFGHITGAKNIPFSEVADQNSPHTLKPVEELEKLFRAVGAKPDTTIVAYCNTGIWGSSIYFVARYLGYRVRFYDGSFQAWSADDRRPVTTDSAPPPE